MSDAATRASECATCAALAAAGVGTEEGQVVPPEADALDVLGPGEGHHGTWQVRRCSGCGTLYRYRHHSEYDVAGSWDEYYLWRLGDAAQAPVRAVLDAGLDELPAALASALRAASGQAREAAMLLAWIRVGEGRALDGALADVARALGDREYMVTMFAYRTLLTYLRRGRPEAVAVQAALDAEAAGDCDHAPILRRECAAMT